MAGTNENNPLHGIKLEMIVTELYEKFGWEELDKKIKLNCFYKDPSIKSTLKFLRTTPWARTKVENLYIHTFKQSKKKEL